MKLDETIPKYATNLAYLSSAKRNDEVESKLFILSSKSSRREQIIISS
jgi:KUP system potassium uptake protein